MDSRQLKIHIADPDTKSKYIYINNVNTTIPHAPLLNFAKKTVALTENTYVSTEIIEKTKLD